MIKLETIAPYWVWFQCEKALANRLNATWNQKRKLWRLPNALGVLEELNNITPHYELERELKRKQLKYSQLQQFKQQEDAPGDLRLRPYQRVDVQYLKHLPHAGLFSEQRTGKTPTALMTLVEEEFDLNIIVCPASLLHNWKGEIEKWVENPTVYVSNGSKKKRENVYKLITTSQGVERSFLIVSYETLRNDWQELRKQWNLYTTEFSFSITCDEAHRLSNYKSKQSKSVYQLAKLANKRLALTGTPTMNHGVDVFGILHFLYPERFPSYWQFAERYFTVYDGWHGGKEIGQYKRQKELLQVISSVSVQRKRAEVMRWLPEKQYMEFELEFEPKQKKVYKDVLKTFEYEENGELLVDAPSVLAQLTRLRQICLAPAAVGVDAPSAKEKWLLEWLEDNPNEKVIIFSNFTSYLIQLQKKIKGSVRLDGTLSATEKSESVRYFQEGTKGTNVLLSNIKAGGQGWTIDQATTTIFLDRHFTPAVNDQAEDRMVSTDPNHITSNTIIDVIIKDSVDQRIHEILKQKEDVTKVINDYKKLKELLQF